MNRWKRKVQALARLAEDQRGKPEGELAREKMRQILARFPEAREYGPVREFMMSDIGWMRYYGVSTDGSWTGVDLQEAMDMMIRDYQQRIECYKARPYGNASS